MHFLCAIHYYIKIFLGGFLKNNPANIPCFPRRLQNVFGITIFCLPRRIPKTFLRCLQDVSEMCLQYVFLKTSSRHVRKKFSRSLAIMSWRRLQDVMKTSWKTKNVTLNTLSRCLQYVFSTFHQDECLLGKT